MMMTRLPWLGLLQGDEHMILIDYCSRELSIVGVLQLLGVKRRSRSVEQKAFAVYSVKLHFF